MISLATALNDEQSFVHKLCQEKEQNKITIIGIEYKSKALEREG